LEKYKINISSHITIKSVLWNYNMDIENKIYSEWEGGEISGSATFNHPVWKGI